MSNVANDQSDSEQPESPEDRDMAILDKHCILLSEHFDNIQIIVTRRDPDSDQTMKANRGYGNWYANYGAVKEWVTENEERSRMHIRDGNE